MKGELSVLRPG